MTKIIMKYLYGPSIQTHGNLGKWYWVVRERLVIESDFLKELTCKRDSVGKSEILLIPRLSVRFR